MNELANLGDGVVLHVSELHEHSLWRVEAYVNGVKIISHTVTHREIGATTLNALASAFGQAHVGSSAVNGAIAWSTVSLSKQEAGHMKRLVRFFWSFVRAFLP
jgi:hypothetical protein